jgi:hypothetical protein
MNRRQVAFLVFVCLLSPAFSNAQEAEDHLPNLVPRPARQLDVTPSFFGEPGTYAVQFSTTAMNAGAFPLDVVGGKLRDPHAGVFVAEQCVHWIAPHVCISRREVGSIYFDFNVTHLHYHFDFLAQYELRRVVDGKVDETTAGLVVPIAKRAFCLQDTGPYGRAATGYAETPPFYLMCTGMAMGISPGWEDEYGPGIYGQEFPTTGLSDGLYAIRIVLNADHRIYESSYDDNVSTRIFALSDGGTKVTPL